MSNEIWWRLGFFFSILVIMMLLESRMPARKSPIKSNTRWFANFGLVFASSLIARLSVPIGLTAVALYNQEHGIGLFNQIATPSSVAIILSMLLLDILIYWQHRLFHRVAFLWRIHRVHHSDPELDVSSAVRFHPIEIVLSLCIKALTVCLLGIPIEAVLVFDILLNASAMFNHTNARLPVNIETWVKKVFVTPDMHRIHHSRVNLEANSNYGFFLSIWDAFFKTKRNDALGGDGNLKIGMPDTVTYQPTSLKEVLVMKNC